jgi:hypothetical protein
MPLQSSKKRTQRAQTPATKIKKAYRTPPLLPVSYTGDEASALFVNANMTKRKYILIRKEAKQRQCNIYSSYDVLEKEKRTCYPVKYCSV